jgi:hypothetical protein
MRSLGSRFYAAIAVLTLAGGAALMLPADSAAADRSCNDMWWIVYECGCVQHDDWNCQHPCGSCPCWSCFEPPSC